jgi:protein involved in polysaccharide export with SLBB domain
MPVVPVTIAALPPVTATNILAAPKETNVPPEDLIHFGDVVEIDVVGSLEYDWQGKITPEGFLAELSFAAEPVLALCQREESVAQKIALAYSKYLRNPQVAVKIVDRSDRPTATLLGAVKTPTTFRIKRAVRLNELIIRAGGVIDNASGEIQIFRPQGLSCGSDILDAANGESGSRFINVTIANLIAGKPDANPFVRTGDIVTVKRSAKIYVIGGVSKPQTIFARQEMTVSRAIATAGGAVKGADMTKAVVYRRINGMNTRINVDLTKIAIKETPDVVLQASDIVEVPQAGHDPKTEPQGIRPEAPAIVILPVIIID